MTKLITLLAAIALSAVALSGCGDNNAKADAAVHPDGLPADAQCSNCPAAPTLGTQIDRMGRPAVNTALNHAFDPACTSTTCAAKDTYNQDSNVATWAASYTAQIGGNLAILDSLDTEICGNGNCETGETNTNCATDCPTTAQVGLGTGCGNQPLYNGTGGGVPTASPNSYSTLAGILADDELQLDTSKTTCAFYLAVEFGVITGGGNMTCGGRAPSYDVIDFSFSAMAIGLKGFSTDGNFTPAFGDGVPAHTDIATTFPYLGPAHCTTNANCVSGNCNTTSSVCQ